MKKLLNISKFLLGWPIAILALFFIFKVVYSNGSQILVSLEHTNFALLVLGVLCFFSYFFTRAILWKQILKQKGYEIPLKELSFLWEISQIKRFVPGNIWSFLGMTVIFSKRGVSKKDIAVSFLAEGVLLVVACAIFSFFSLPFIFFILTPVVHVGLWMIFVALFLFIVISVSIYKFYSQLLSVLKGFSIWSLVFLLMISILCLFFFGIGTYFTISSIVFLEPYYLLTFIGFFVFSLMIGYLSFITPMGLGVREGIMTIGLAKFIPLSLAGLGSIFARVILILSEIIFLVFAFVWYHSKNRVVLFLENFIGEHKQAIFLSLFILIYIIYFTTASFFRYDNFYAGRFDLGNMDQTVWNTLHGRTFQLTDPDGTNNISRLAFHADFILILITPFYYVWNDPRMLLLIQTVVLGIGAIFAYLLAKHVLKNKNLALVFSSVYLLSPAIQYTNLYDFHAVSLATTFLLAAFYYMIKKKYILFIIFSVLSAVTKEQVWAIISLFGLYLIVSNIYLDIKRVNSNKNRSLEYVLGLILFLFSIGVFYYLISIAIPSARGGNHFAISYYSDFGSSPGSIIGNLIIHPQKTILAIVQPAKLHYLNQLFLPLGYLSLFSPLYLIFLLPDLLINLLSNNLQLHQIYFQYSATITPFIFISAIYGIKQIKKIFPKIPIFAFVLYLTIATLYSAYSFGPLPGSKTPNIDMFVKPYIHKNEVVDFLAHISKRYSIAATNNLGAHLSHRKNIYTIPIGVDKANIVIFLLNDQFAQPSLKAQKEMVTKLKSNPRYIVIKEIDDFIAFKKIN
ncbi:MAG: DUF2079 domain-containing protein [Patescibacteria group bacterium]|nr:DUF2079 domain-containing protein [Patescibacteria group bacterium]